MARWQKGQSGNPRGRPLGTRHKISEVFLKDLLDDYAEHGAEAIVKLRENHPGRYIELIAKLLPKYVDVDAPFTLVDLLIGLDADDQPSEDEPNADISTTSPCNNRNGADDG